MRSFRTHTRPRHEIPFVRSRVPQVILKDLIPFILLHSSDTSLQVTGLTHTHKTLDTPSRVSELSYNNSFPIRGSKLPCPRCHL